jgi:hypothetical protein
LLKENIKSLPFRTFYIISQFNHNSLFPSF